MEIIYKLTSFLVFLTINTLHCIQYATSDFATRKDVAKENKFVAGENNQSNLLIFVYVVFTQTFYTSEI